MIDDTDTVPPGPEDPREQAHEAAAAMRARGGDRPDIERALIGGAERHSRFVERQGLSPGGSAKPVEG